MNQLTTLDFTVHPLLIVDCEPNLLTSLEKSLSRMGLRWRTQSQISEQEQTFSALLIDSQNFKSESLIHKHQQLGTPIIAITAHEGLTEIQRIISFGATALLHKPITQRAIYSTLMMAIGLNKKFDENLALINRLNRKYQLVPLLCTTLAWMMVHWEIDQDEAYRWLRTEAMRTHQSIESVCLKLKSQPQQGLKK